MYDLKNKLHFTSVTISSSDARIWCRWKSRFILTNGGTKTKSKSRRQLISTAGQPKTEIANPPTLEEIMVAIKSTKSGKTPGLGGLPAEIYKVLHAQLLKFYRTCWTANELPQQFKDALVIAIYKKKDDRGDCGNYRGISLL